MKTKLGFTLFLLSVLVLCAGLALAKEDPELKQCKQQCKVQQQFDDKQTKQCLKKCEDYYKHKKKGSGDEEREWGGGSGDVDEREKQLRDCEVKCDEQHYEGGQQRQVCRSTCRSKFMIEKDDRVSKNHYKEEDEGQEEEGEEEEKENPYVFEVDYFLSKIKTTHGSMMALPDFSRISKFLRGIKEYRLGILSIQPQVILTPNYLDADALFFVTSGRGTITLIHEYQRHKFELEEGVLFRLPAGTTYYVVNSDNRESLNIAQLLLPVSNPGRFEPFFWAAGGNPESFLNAFSSEILEAAFKVSRDELQNLFERQDQDQGVFVKASREQIRALSDTEESSGIWPFGSQSSKGTFRLFKKRPTHSNRFGQHYEVDHNDYSPLEHFDYVTLSFANITQRAMIAPYLNSASTKIALVVGGEGFIQMACPHIQSSTSSEQQQGGSSRQQHQGGRSLLKSRVSYRKISAPLRTGTAFVVPAGHPVVTIASNKGNLQVVCFELNSKNNVKYFIAGKQNVVKLMEREAKELTFNAKEQQVDRVFGKQEEEFFVQGPNWRQQPRQGQGQGRADE